ncbi:MAG: hypothetical protein J5974_04530, partial [Pyramidobacter sp.]|nr:hypothetical protein [Pyramidobacter sp.]
MSNSVVYANSITVSADEDYKLRAHAWGASGAGFGAGLVYVQVINVGDAGTISDPDNQKQLASVADLRDKALDKLQGFVDGTSGAVSSRVLTEKEAAAAKAARTGNPVIKNSENSTLHVTIDSASVLDASGDVTIAGTEKTDIISYQGGVTGALGAGAVNLGFMSVAKQSGVTLDAAKLNAGGAVSVTSQLTGTNNQHIVQGTGGAGSIFTAYGHAKSAGKAAITALSSDIAGAKGVSLAALDSAVTDSYGAGGSAGIGTYGGIVARAITDDTVSVTFDGGRLSSGGDAVLKAKRTGETFAQDVFGYIGVASGIGADARASESTNVNVSVGSGDTTTISAKKFAVHSELNPFVHARVYQDGGSASTSVGVPLAKASLSGGSTVTLGAKNAYAAPAVSVESFVGGSADKGAQLFARVDSYGGTLIGIEYQYSRAEVTNDSTAAIDMKGGAFDAKTLSALSMHALNSSTLSADMETIRVGGLAIGSANNAAHVTNHGKATITMTSANAQTLASMDVKAESISDSKARANGDGGSAVYIDNASSSSGSSKAAWTKTDVQNTASVDISGQWKTNGDLKLTAAQTAKTTDWADAVIGGAITVNGTQHDLGLTGNAAVTVAKGAVLSADGAMTLEASNTLSDNPNNAYTSSGNSYGAVSGNGTKNNATVTQNATVSIAEDAALYSAGATSLLAHSDSSMNEYARIVSGGVGAGSDAVNNFTGTWNNTITIQSGADVTTNGDASDVTLAAWDNATLKLTALGDMQGGVVGGATSKLDFTLNRNNAVNVAGTILSGRDVNLWAGQNSAGEKSRFTVNGISHAYAHGPITGASAKLNRTINQKSTVTIDGDVSSTRHANLAALTGELIKIESAERYAWTSSKKTGSVSSTALGDTVGGLNDNNTVTVNGTVNAGIHNKFVMNIGEGFALLEDSTGSGDYAPIAYEDDGSGNKVMYVKILSDDVKTVISDDAGQSEGTQKSITGYVQGTSTDYDYKLTIAGQSQTPEITLAAGSGSWTLGQVDDYATYLYERLEVLNDLIDVYSGVDHQDSSMSAAYLAFYQERQIIEATLAQYGLPPNRNEGAGRTAFLFVPYIEIAPVTVSGGNVVVNTTSLKGTGTLNANGAPEITVNNASNYSLKLTGMNILAPGGEVIVNTFSVKNTDDMHERVKKASSGFTGIVSADAHSDKTAAVTVKNTWANAYIAVSFDANPAKPSLVSGDKEAAVVSDIENTGGIRNYPGTVELTTAVGSIRSVSGDIVAGKGVKLSAPRGAITINSEGILNVGGAPEEAYKKLIEYCAAYNDTTPTSLDMSDPSRAKSLFYFLLHNNGLDLGSPSGIVAGGSVYITAGVINVNGTIQSGYGKYELKLGEAEKARMTQLTTLWDKKPLPDDPAELSSFVLTEGGDSWDDEQRVFVRNPAAWYNPSTGKIVLEDMIGAGGNVFLTGRIVNTNYWDQFTDDDYTDYGNIRSMSVSQDVLPTVDQLKSHRSQIIAFSGAAEVSIESSLETTVRLGAIDTGMRSGHIVINDVRTVTENGRSVTHSVSGVSGDVFKTQVVSMEIPFDGDTSGTFEPQEGVRYNVGAGVKKHTTEREKQWEYFNWWRDSWKDKTPDGKSYEKVTDHIDTAMSEDATVSLLNDIGRSGDNRPYDMDPSEIVWLIKNSIEQSKDVSDWNYDVHYNNWTHFAGKITRTQITTTGTQSTSLISLKADNPIHVEIKTAQKPGQITVSAPSADVELTGTLRSSVPDAAVSITAKDIVAETGGTIVADKVLLNASGAIAGEDKRLHLRPLGDVVELTAAASNGMAFDIDSGSAKVTLNSNGEKGTIKVDSEGSLTGEATGTNMDLLSRNGSIEMNVKGSETKLKAKAADDISIVKVDEGDLAIERVEAENDVFLETKQGSIVDANPTVNQQSLTDEALIDLWKNAGLISDDESGSRMTAKMREDNIANLENIVRSEYATYQHVKQLLADADARIADGLMTPEQKALFEKQRDALQSYAGVTDIDAYIAEQKKKSGSALYELSTIDENEGWTKDYLLYSIQDAILNPTAGSVKPNAQEIVVGSTVTLKSSVNIGSEGEEQTIKGGDALLENDMKGLKALSQASPADVTWDEDSSSFIVQDSYEIGLTAGKTTAQAQDLVLIASPLEDLVIDSVESKNGGKVHLMAAGSVLLHPSTDITPAVKGGDMFISAAGEASDIGSADRAVTIEQTTGSELRANAGRSIYLTAESGDLMLGSIAARDTLAVETTEEGANILMSKGEGRLNARAVLLAVNSGDIGTEELPVRVQNAQSNDFRRSVTLSGANNAYLSGENGAQPEGWLNLNAGTLHNAVVTSDGGLNISGDMTASGAGTFAASSDVVMLGSLTGGSLNVTAQNGAAVFDGPITAGKLFVRAHDDLELNEPVNVEYAAELNVSAGSIEVRCTFAAHELEAVAAGASSDIILGKDVKVAEDLTLAASHDVIMLSPFAGGTLTASAGRSAKFDGAIDADGAVTVDAGEDLTTAELKSNADVTLDAGGSIAVNGALKGNEVKLSSGTNVTVKGTTTAETLRAESGSDTMLGGVKAATVTARAGSSITTGAVTAQQTVDMAASRDITVDGTLNGAAVTLDAGRNITVNGTAIVGALAISSGANTTLSDVDAYDLTANAGGSLTTAGVTAENVSLDAGADIIVDGSLTADDPQLTAGENVAVKGTTTADALTVKAGKNVTLARTIVLTVDVNAGGHVSMEDRGNDMEVLNLSADSASVY